MAACEYTISVSSDGIAKPVNAAHEADRALRYDHVVIAEADMETLEAMDTFYLTEIELGHVRMDDARKGMNHNLLEKDAVASKHLHEVEKRQTELLHRWQDVNAELYVRYDERSAAAKHDANIKEVIRGVSGMSVEARYPDTEDWWSNDDEIWLQSGR